MMRTPLSKRLRSRQQELGLSDADVARRLSISQRRYNNYSVGLREPPVDILAKLSAVLRMHPSDLLGVKIGMTESDDTLIRIDVLDVQPTAGAGQVVPSEDTIGHVVFDMGWLRTLTVAPVNQLKVIKIDGDSMAQTLHAGDQVLIDMVQVNPRRDGIYVFEWDGLLSVKRITADPTTKTISITSDNKEYISRTNVSPEDVRVIGRVIWMGRRV
jgi:phage repressor protein C with HTH and peptisase S24 domain